MSVGLLRYPQERVPWRRLAMNLTSRIELARTALLLAIGVLLTGCQPIRRYEAKRHVASGDSLVAQDDLESALKEFQAAAELDPQMATAHSRMGVLYRRLGEYDLAIDAFVEAIRRDPFSFDDTFNLAQLYHFSKRLADAVRAYLHAVDLKPQSFDAQLNLGVCYQQMGDHAAAAERFRRAIAIDADRPHAYVNLGVAYDAQEKYYEAVRAFKEALERDATQPQVLVNLANTYMKQNRLKTAGQTLESALEMDPTLAAAHEALGYCRFQLRDYAAAELAYKDALAYDRRLPRSFAGLGSIQMLRYLEDRSDARSRDAALEYWHRSLEVDPDQPRIRALIERYQPALTDPAQALLNEAPRP